MKVSDLKLRLLNRLREVGEPATSAGIDLGTTKSCIAYAKYDPVEGTLDCRCIEFERPDGTRSVAFPSAVAQQGERRLFGAEALALRKTPGIRAERDLFYETKNLIGLRYTFKDAPEGLRNPAEVAAALIGHLREGSRGQMPGPVLNPVVVTCLHGDVAPSADAFRRSPAGCKKMLRRAEKSWAKHSHLRLFTNSSLPVAPFYSIKSASSRHFWPTGTRFGPRSLYMHVGRPKRDGRNRLTG